MSKISGLTFSREHPLGPRKEHRTFSSDCGVSRDLETPRDMVSFIPVPFCYTQCCLCWNFANYLAFIKTVIFWSCIQNYCLNFAVFIGIASRRSLACTGEICLRKIRGRLTFNGLHRIFSLYLILNFLTQ